MCRRPIPLTNDLAVIRLQVTLLLLHCTKIKATPLSYHRPETHIFGSQTKLLSNFCFFFQWLGPWQTTRGQKELYLTCRLLSVPLHDWFSHQATISAITFKLTKDRGQSQSTSAKVILCSSIWLVIKASTPHTHSGPILIITKDRLFKNIKYRAFHSTCTVHCCLYCADVFRDSAGVNSKQAMA